MPFIPSEIECNINIEPQYDGVVMLSSDAAFFNDAQPRPDGRKIYHIFEHSEDEILEESSDKFTKEFDTRKKELFAKASEHSLQNIQQILAKNGISMQECCPSLSPSASQILQSNTSFQRSDTYALDSSASAASQYSLALPSVDNQEILTTIVTQRMVTPIFFTDEFDLLECHNFKLYKIYQFYINFPAELQSSSSRHRLMKRLNKRGILDIEVEPENFRITLKSLRSAQFILKILRKIDQNVILLSTTYDLVLTDDNDSEETLQNIGTYFSDL